MARVNWYGDPLYSAPLTVRVLNALENAGYEYIGEVQKDFQSIMNVRGFGKTCRDEVEPFLITGKPIFE